MKEIKRVQSIDRAVMILKLFTNKDRELKLTKIAEELNLHKSTTFGILNTLKHHGLIRQNEENQKYSLGIKLLEFGNLSLSCLDIHQIADSILSNIRDVTEETVCIGILDGFDMVYIDKKETYQSMRFTATIGTKYPAYCTSAGKAMLAYFDQELIDAEFPSDLESYTVNTITSKSLLIKELKEVRENGYSIECEEIFEGIISVAVPILDFSGQARYAISVSGPTSRMNDKKIHEIIKLLRNATENVSMKLGYIEY